MNFYHNINFGAPTNAFYYNDPLSSNQQCMPFVLNPNINNQILYGHKIAAAQQQRAYYQYKNEYEQNSLIHQFWQLYNQGQIPTNNSNSQNKQLIGEVSILAKALKQIQDFQNKDNNEQENQDDSITTQSKSDDDDNQNIIKIPFPKIGEGWKRESNEQFVSLNDGKIIVNSGCFGHNINLNQIVEEILAEIKTGSNFILGTAAFNSNKQIMCQNSTAQSAKPCKIIRMGYKKRQRGSINKSTYRSRKNQEQKAILQQHFDKNPNWSKKQIKYLSQIAGLSENQVYKWQWDQTLKYRAQNMNM